MQSYSKFKTVISLGKEVMKKPKALLSVLRFQNFNKLTKALREESPQQIIRNFQHLLAIKSIPLTAFSKEISFLNPAKRSIIFVSHDANISGAPLIILELGRHFKQKYDCNVVCILLGTGKLLNAFKALGPTILINPIESKQQNLAIRQALAKGNFAGALINSVQSERAMDLVKDLNAPKLYLIHEFISFFPDKDYGKISTQADKIIFPSAKVLEAAEQYYTFPKEKLVVKGQGLLKPELLHTKKDASQKALRELLGLPQHTKIVLGCGTISSRKGTDIFILTAIEVLKHRTEEVFFLWLGGKPNKDDPSKWMYHDAKSSKLSASILFVDEVVETDLYFAGADIFFLSSRLDPFPCVVHEAMASRTPIIAFDGGGGYINLFSEKIGKLVPYGDILRAADAILEILSAPSLAQEMGNNGREVIKRDFNFEQYSSFLHNLISTLPGVPSLTAKGEGHLFSSLDSRGKKNQRKKIIFLTPNWQLSGVNTFVEHLVSHLISSDYEVELLFTNHHALDIEESILPALPIKFLVTEELTLLKKWQLLKDYLHANAPCVVIPNYDYIGSAISPELSNGVGILGILHSDDIIHYEHGYRLGHYWNKIVSVSKTIQSTFLAMNPVFEPKSSVIHYGIDVPNRIKFPPKNEIFSIVYAGRIVQKQKQVLDFIPIIELLGKSGIDFRFTFIGNGEQAGELEAGLSKYVHAGKVRFLGRQPQSVIFEELSKSHVLAMVSAFEGLSLALLEGLAHHCVPVVTEIESGIDEIIENGKNGLTIPQRDPTAYADALLSLAHDRQKWQNMAEEAFSTLEKHKLRNSDMGEKYIQLIEEIFEDIESGKFKRPPSLSAHPELGGILIPPMFLNKPN